MQNNLFLYQTIAPKKNALWSFYFLNFNVLLAKALFYMGAQDMARILNKIQYLRYDNKTDF